MKRLEVHDLMRPNVPTVGPESHVARVRDLMYRDRVRHVPVVDAGGGFVGLVSHRDLLRDADLESYDRPVWVEQERLEAIPVSAVMKSVVETVAPGDSAAEAGRRLLREKLGCLPVVEEGRFLGVVTEADFVRYVVDQAG